jgi:Dolichyl-phosphate-mannose-protein mannosyltransferase
VPVSATTGPVYGKTILGVALLLRLAVVGMVVARYPRNWLFSKAPDLGFLAASIAAGHGLSSPFGGSTGPTAFLAPGYPALLGLIFSVFGSYSRGSAIVMMALETLFALLTVAVMMHLAQAIFGAPTANLAGTFWALSPPLLWLPAVLWETSLSTLLLAGMVALAVSCASQPRRRLWLGMGAYCGLGMLVNPALMPAFLALLGWTAWQTRSPNQLWPCLLLAALIFAPWPIRNWRVLHAWIPFRSNFGYELWQGNHPGASGLFDARLEPLRNRHEYADYAALGEVTYMGNKAALAQAYIRSHPVEFLRLNSRRVARFWTGAGSESNSGVVELHAVTTSLLGLLGLGMLCKQRPTTATLFLLPLILFPSPYYITHPDFRFRLVLDPLLSILSAFAVIRLRAQGTLAYDQLRKVLSPGDASLDFSRHRIGGDAGHAASLPSAAGQVYGVVPLAGFSALRTASYARLRSRVAAVFPWPACPVADRAVRHTECSR